VGGHRTGGLRVRSLARGVVKMEGPVGPAGGYLMRWADPGQRGRSVRRNSLWGTHSGKVAGVYFSLFRQKG